MDSDFNEEISTPLAGQNQNEMNKTQNEFGSNPIFT
jgi:hypothetical protein